MECGAAMGGSCPALLRIGVSPRGVFHRRGGESWKGGLSFDGDNRLQGSGFSVSRETACHRQPATPQRADRQTAGKHTLRPTAHRWAGCAFSRDEAAPSRFPLSRSRSEPLHRSIREGHCPGSAPLGASRFPRRTAAPDRRRGGGSGRSSCPAAELCSCLSGVRPTCRATLLKRTTT